MVGTRTRVLSGPMYERIREVTSRSSSARSRSRWTLDGVPASGAAQARHARRRWSRPRRRFGRGDEADLKAVVETEWHLLYVASARARGWLLVTGVERVSEFVEDLQIAKQ